MRPLSRMLASALRLKVSWQLGKLLRLSQALAAPSHQEFLVRQ